VVGHGGEEFSVEGPEPSSQYNNLNKCRSRMAGVLGDIHASVSARAPPLRTLGSNILDHSPFSTVPD